MSAGARYLRAWDALGRLLTNGRSLSGHERNCCFLNTGTGRFANVSAATALDYPDDSRGVGVVDWDGDGDLDLWITNRTAPRIRYLRNDMASGHHFLAVRLEGVSCNRDAIGARVELLTGDRSEQKQIRTLRAGEGYLAQSSKSIYFGLGDNTSIERLVVRWPGGPTEEFRGLVADRRYTLVQGSGKARLSEPTGRPVQLAAAPSTKSTGPRTLRIIPHRRLPLPRLDYVDFQGRPVRLLESSGGPQLICLWATWCQPCLGELRELAEEEPKLRALGLETVLINLDDLTEPIAPRSDKAKRALEQLDVPVRGGVATATLVETLDVVQRAILSKQSPLPLPSSFLVDREGRLAAIYKGAVPIDELQKVVSRLERPGSDSADAAVPFAGRWYVNPLPADLLAIPQKLLEISLAAEALDYVQRHVPVTLVGENTQNEAILPESLSPQRVAAVYFQAALELAKQQDRAAAIRALETALAVRPDFWDARAALANVLELEGRVADALSQYDTMLKSRPGHPVVANNVAWLLATSPDQSIRNAEEAIKQAEHVCRVTRWQVPSALDTLAVAYAAAGRFEEAIEIAGKAIQLASAASQPALAENIRRRLTLYQQKRPYLEEVPHEGTKEERDQRDQRDERESRDDRL